MPSQETMTSDQVAKLIGKPYKAVGKKSGGRYGKRSIPGEMNKTEAEFADLLEAQKLKGEIIEWLFHPGSLRYGKDARFSTDFMIIHNDGGIELVDTKGSSIFNEASTCRAKACAERFWFFTFSQYEKLPKKAGWKRTEY